MNDNKKRLAPWLKVLIIGLGLFILGLAGVFITMSLVIKGHEVRVPSLAGKDIVYALETLNELGLGLKISEQEFNSFIAENHIISQQPAKGSFIKKGRRIRVVLSKGSQMVLVPDVEEHPLSLAQLKLKREGLKTGQLTRIYHNLALDKVIAQYPPTGGHAARGNRVNLLLSKGLPPLSYIMPDLIGMPLSVATIRIKTLGVEVGQVTTEVYQSALSQTVINQLPRSGYLVMAGQKVSLVVSEGE